MYPCVRELRRQGDEQGGPNMLARPAVCGSRLSDLNKPPAVNTDLPGPEDRLLECLIKHAPSWRHRYIHAIEHNNQ